MATTRKKDKPKIKWRKSKAKSLLYADVREGRVPPDAHGPWKMKLDNNYNSRPEFKEYHRSKLSSRLSNIWQTIRAANNRASMDQEAYNNFKATHPPFLFSIWAISNGKDFRPKKGCWKI
jgi:hypothetical protein